MRATNRILGFLGLAILPFAIAGCTVVSANRVFPKLSWYWSADAQAQREERRQERQWRQEQATNQPVQPDRTELVMPVGDDGVPFIKGSVDIARIKQRDGTNYIGVYMGMIAEHASSEVGMDLGDHGNVMMFSATSGELLKLISYEDFKAIFVDKSKPEYH